MPWREWFRRKPTGPRKSLVEDVVNKPSYHAENSIYHRLSLTGGMAFRRARALGFRTNNGGLVERNVSGSPVDPVDAIKELTDDLGAMDRVLLELRWGDDK